MTNDERRQTEWSPEDISTTKRNSSYHQFIIILLCSTQHCNTTAVLRSAPEPTSGCRIKTF